MSLDLHLFTTRPFPKNIFNAERKFKEIYFKMVIPVKDTANPLSHHALASLYFFIWIQALAPVKA